MMTTDSEHVMWIVEKWQEITVIAAMFLTLLGVTRKKTAGKMLVTREYLDSKLTLHDEQMKNAVKDAVKEGLATVYDEIHRVDGRVDGHLNNLKP